MKSKRFVLETAHTRKLRVQNGSGSMYPYQRLCHQIWYKSLSFFEITSPIILSHLLSLLWMDWIHEAQLRWNCSFVKLRQQSGKNLWHTGTTEHKTQQCRSSDRFCRWLDHWICGATHTYPVQMQENQLFNLQEHFERYSIVFPVFGSNSSKKGISLTKSYLLTILVNERDIELTVKQTAK